MNNIKAVAEQIINMATSETKNYEGCVDLLDQVATGDEIGVLADVIRKLVEKLYAVEQRKRNKPKFPMNPLFITEGVGKQKDGSVNVAPVIAYDLDRLNQLRADETKQITIKVERLDAIATAYKTKHTNEVANQVDVNLPLAIAVGNNKNRGWRYHRDQ